MIINCAGFPQKDSVNLTLGNFTLHEFLRTANEGDVNTKAF